MQKPNLTFSQCYRCTDFPCYANTSQHLEFLYYNCRCYVMKVVMKGRNITDTYCCRIEISGSADEQVA